jgi:hypothetical protein
MHALILLIITAKTGKFEIRKPKFEFVRISDRFKLFYYYGEVYVIFPSK